MQLCEIPRDDQLSIGGTVLNVPVGLQPIIKAWSRQIEETTIPVRLKRKMVYKKCEFTENVHPCHVLTTVHHFFQNSNLYKDSGIKINNKWCSQMTSDANEIVKSFTGNSNVETKAHAGDHDEGRESDSFSEIADEDRIIGNADTLIEQISPQVDILYTLLHLVMEKAL